MNDHNTTSRDGSESDFDASEVMEDGNLRRGALHVWRPSEEGSPYSASVSINAVDAEAGCISLSLGEERVKPRKKGAVWLWPEEVRATAEALLLLAEQMEAEAKDAAEAAEAAEERSKYRTLAVGEMIPYGAEFDLTGNGCWVPSYLAGRRLHERQQALYRVETGGDV